MPNPLIVLNPFIWLWNYFKYCAHLEIYRGTSQYVPYDFDNDMKYF